MSVCIVYFSSLWFQALGFRYHLDLDWIVRAYLSHIDRPLGMLPFLGGASLSYGSTWQVRFTYLFVFKYTALFGHT